MSEPVIAKKGSYAFDLGPGEYWWCTCGHAKTQPFCDGSHTGTGLEPVPFTISKRKKVDLCGCKRSKTCPFCDGTHKQLA